MKYRKKPVEVDAYRFGYDITPMWLIEAITNGVAMYYYDESVRRLCVIISTLEGDMRAYEGDYIIRGIQGEIYPCKSDIFEATYEPVEE